jgi:hypothetical protein
MDGVDPHFLFLRIQEGEDLLFRVPDRTHECTSSLLLHLSPQPYATSLSKDFVVERHVEEGLLGNRARFEGGAVVHDLVQQRLRQKRFVAQSKEVSLFITPISLHYLLREVTTVY